MLKELSDAITIKPVWQTGVLQISYKSNNIANKMQVILSGIKRFRTYSKRSFKTPLSREMGFCVLVLWWQNKLYLSGLMY